MLPKKHRLRAKADFKNVFLCGRSASGAGLGLRITKNNLAVTRFGFVVSNKTAGSAAGRNLIKRRMRAAAQKVLQDVRPGYDAVIIAQPATRGKKFAEIFEIIQKLLTQAGLCGRLKT